MGAGDPALFRHAFEEARSPWLMPLAGLAAFAPPVWLWASAGRDRRLLGAMILSAAPVCLLYPVASDWGRWVSLQVSILSLLLLGLAAAGRFAPPLPRRRVMALWLAVGLSIGLQTMIDIWPGAIVTRLVHGFDL